MPGFLSTLKEAMSNRKKLANVWETNSDSTGSVAIEPTPGKLNYILKKVFSGSTSKTNIICVMHYFLSKEFELISALHFLVSVKKQVWVRTQIQQKTCVQIRTWLQ
jgi:hypothetical protein